MPRPLVVQMAVSPVKCPVGQHCFRPHGRLLPCIPLANHVAIESVLTMHVTILESIHYPEASAEGDHARFGPKPVVTHSPTFDEIEAAIRRLDRDEWPYVWLHTEAPLANEFPNNLFQIMGGRGEYALTLYKDGDEIHYLDRSRRDEGDSIQIWESDQGSDRRCEDLCNDISRVIGITRRFCEFGELDSSVTWDVR
jgi:hypothetical protein